MKRIVLLSMLLIMTGLTVVPAQGASAPPENRNRMSLAFDAGFNIRAEFRNLAPDVAPPPATGSGLTGDPVDRNYDDGYNRVDFFDNGAGLTWNWGYQDAAQYDPAGSTLALHAATRSGSGSSETATDDPQLGFELKYGRVIGVLGENNPKPWGFEAAFGYMNLSVRDDSPLASVQRVTDTYALGVVVPPPAPYQGTFNGPGPLIPDLPARAIETAQLSGWNELDGSLFALRLGPFLEIPLTVRLTSSGLDDSSSSSKFVAQVGAGLSLIYADTDFSYDETATFADGSSFNDAGDDSSSDVLFGGYLQGQVGYFMGNQWSVFAGVRLETASSLTATAGNREAKLDLGGTLHGFLGVGYSF